MKAMEKRDMAMGEAMREGLLEGMTKADIQKKRKEIKPVENTLVNVPDSDDEDAKKDLLLRRRLFLKKARSVASSRRVRGRLLLEAVERPGSSQLQVSNLLELAEANVPLQKPQVVPSPPDPYFVPESPLSSSSQE
ncbi:hypothetical protein ACROYT_G031097 [Oculina patagonica]